MQCPHCLCEFDTKPHTFSLGIDRDGTWQVAETRCPTCERLIVSLCTDSGCSYPAWPVGSTRPRLSEDVPAEIAAEYHTAAQVIHYSPEASAAISRRLLHRFLEERVGVTGDLAGQIELTAGSLELPAYLREALAAFAQVAGLSANQEKSSRPEALAPVRAGEAEWLLDVLEALADLYFVRPATVRRRRTALEAQVGPLVPALAPESGLAEPAPESEPPAETADDGGREVVEAPAQEGRPATSPVTDAESEAAASTAPMAEAEPAAFDPIATETPPAPATPTQKESGGWLRLGGRGSDERR